MKTLAKPLFLAIFLLAIKMNLQAQCIPNVNTGNDIHYNVVTNLQGTNLISIVTTGNTLSDGVNTYHEVILNVAYYTNPLTGTLTIKNNVNSCNGGNNCSRNTKVTVNNSSPVTLNSNTYTSQISSYTTSYTYVLIKGYCGTNLYTTKGFAIKVVREPAPVLNLTFSRACEVNPQTEDLTGRIVLYMSGNVINANYLYLRIDRNNAAGNTYHLGTLMGDPQNPVTASVLGSSIFTTASSGFYTVNLMFRGPGMNSYQLISSLYSFSKLGITCINSHRWDHWVLGGGKTDGSFVEEEGSMRAFPNPSQGFFTLQLPEGINKGILTVTDMQGRKVRTLDVQSAAVQIDLTQEGKGLYYLSFSNEEGLTWVQKVCIE